MIVKFQPVFSDQLEYYIDTFRSMARDGVVARGKFVVEFASDLSEAEIIAAVAGETLPAPAFSAEP